MRKHRRKTSSGSDSNIFSSASKKEREERRRRGSGHSAAAASPPQPPFVLASPPSPDAGLGVDETGDGTPKKRTSIVKCIGWESETAEDEVMKSPGAGAGGGEGGEGGDAGTVATDTSESPGAEEEECVRASEESARKCSSAAEAGRGRGHMRGCRGETPRTPPAVGEVGPQLTLPLRPLRSRRYIAVVVDDEAMVDWRDKMGIPAHPQSSLTCSFSFGGAGEGGEEGAGAEKAGDAV
jgi:hypothetical protein